ncbi:MAG: hypothetical protein ACI9N1_001300 [Flavobacteriales bacterium]|jgi:hypothetical protein
MKYLLLSLFSIAILAACGGPKNTDAESICSCFNRSTIDRERTEIAIDSCKQLYKKALTQLEGDEAGKKQFAAAFDYCRNNK